MTVMTDKIQHFQEKWSRIELNTGNFDPSQLAYSSALKRDGSFDLDQAKSESNHSSTMIPNKTFGYEANMDMPSKTICMVHDISEPTADKIEENAILPIVSNSAIAVLPLIVEEQHGASDDEIEEHQFFEELHSK